MTRAQVRELRVVASFAFGHAATPVAWIPTYEDACRWYATHRTQADEAVEAQFRTRWPDKPFIIGREAWEFGTARRQRTWDRHVANAARTERWHQFDGLKLVSIHVDGVFTRDVT